MSEVAYVLVDKDERRLTVAGLLTVNDLVRLLKKKSLRRLFKRLAHDSLHCS